VNGAVIFFVSLALPTTLEAIAERCVPGGGALRLERLSVGLVNISCRVERAGGVYALRVAGEEAQGLGLDREWECRVLAVAAAAGLAPRLEQCHSEPGIVVAEWVEGQALSIEEVARDDVLEAVAELLRRIHALPVPQPLRAMDAASWIELYLAAARLRDCALPAWVRPLQAGAATRLQALAELGPVATVLCHSDLHRQNIVRRTADGRLVLLDWEYAHVADSLWDVAGWAANTDETGRRAEQLLTCYLRRTPSAAESQRLRVLAWLYDYVCLLWSSLYLQLRSDAGVAAVAARAETVARRLSRDVW
jgi:thiamine kinase-like enzyme